MEIEQGILLSSYEIPKGEDKNTFSYDSMKNVDYSKLEKSVSTNAGSKYRAGASV